MSNKDLKRNGSGCIDRTAYEAVQNADRESQMLSNLMNEIHFMCHLAGFCIEGEFGVRSEKTNKVWRFKR